MPGLFLLYNTCMAASTSAPMRNLIRVFLSWLAAWCLSACSLSAPNPTASPSPAFTPIPTFTLTSEPASTAIPTQPPVPTPPATATPFEPFLATVWADNVNVRINPGYLFDIRANLPQDTQVVVLGRSLGDEWMYVRLPSGAEGWVFAQLLESGVDLHDAPVIEPGPVQVVTGQVLDENGGPISGVQFALIKGLGDRPPRTDAVTGPDGLFYAFLPLNADGEWNIYYTAIACTSNVMDQDCNCLDEHCGQPYPSDLNILLPLGEPLYFIWK